MITALTFLITAYCDMLLPSLTAPVCLQILAMSATVQNPEALGGWISEVSRV